MTESCRQTEHRDAVILQCKHMLELKPNADCIGGRKRHNFSAQSDLCKTLGEATYQPEQYRVKHKLESTCILGGLALSIVEVGRNGDDCILDGLAKIRLSSVLHLGEDHGADLLW